MKKSLFRPCIDLHNGKVKQIVGSTLKEDESGLTTNFISDQSSGYFADRYKKDHLGGGHVIMLGSGNEEAAKEALGAFYNGLQIGGGINDQNAEEYIAAGASHVIVTSWLFNQNGEFLQSNLDLLLSQVGIDRLVIDLSCKQTNPGEWVIAMNRWQTLTNLSISKENLSYLSGYCSEFLVHAADFEGKCQGMDIELIQRLSDWVEIPVTYAGGVRDYSDLERVQNLSEGSVDVAVGSSLDLFGGNGLTYDECVQFNRR
jgi:phosphoribosylformimino-5-aminoimidazole carboxamide ribotide isomerase